MSKYTVKKYTFYIDILIVTIYIFIITIMENKIPVSMYVFCKPNILPGWAIHSEPGSDFECVLKILQNLDIKIFHNLECVLKILQIVYIKIWQQPLLVLDVIEFLALLFLLWKVLEL